MLARIQTIASNASSKVLLITDWIGKQFHISSKWASRGGFIVLWGVGMTFIQVDEYALALVSLLLSAIVLLSKAIHWPGITVSPRLTVGLRVLYIFAAILFIPLSFMWTQSKRGDKAWTAFRWTSKPTVTKANVTPPPEVTPALYLGCVQIAPPWPLPPGSTLHFAGLDLLQGINSVVSTLESKDTTYWPSPVHTGGAFTFRCDLTNDSAAPVFNVNFCLRGELADGARSARDVHGFASRIDGNGGKFTFYIWNSNPEVATAILPPAVTLETEKNTRQHKVEIRRSGEFLVFTSAELSSGRIDTPLK